MNILSLYERFSFSIIPCSLGVARTAILAQSAAWGKPLSVDRATVRDIRPIFNSPDGPAHPPAVRKAILLSEVVGPEGVKTLFVSSVADGYSSMVYTISGNIPGLHLSVQISRLSIEYPRNAMMAIKGQEDVRVVYSMRDGNSWEFFERGRALHIEQIEFYKARRKRDRLTPEIIDRYISNLGYGTLDEEFWTSNEPAHLICDASFRLAEDPKPDMASSDGKIEGVS
jgi:hypothetical protein